MARIATIATIAACTLLGACASTAPGGRSQIVAPSPVSSLYSSIDMNLRLASATAITTNCVGEQCQVDQSFDRQVSRLGARLAKSAYETQPGLKERVPDFNFIVADKSEAGTASNASGTVVIYRGMRKPGFEEGLLAFLIAREMGHVIARHHDEKSAVRIIASAVVAVLLPVTNLAGAAAFLAGSAASTAGANVIAPDGDPGKTREATSIAMDLLARQGWHPTEINRTLSAYAGTLDENEWRQSIRDSLSMLETADTQPALLALEHSPTIEATGGTDDSRNRRSIKAPHPKRRKVAP
jgi:predicted Zn-dependent protease